MICSSPIRPNAGFALSGAQTPFNPPLVVLGLVFLCVCVLQVLVFGQHVSNMAPSAEHQGRLSGSFVRPMSTTGSLTQRELKGDPRVGPPRGSLVEIIEYGIPMVSDHFHF